MLHVPSTIALNGPLAGTLANAGFSAQAYLSSRIFSQRAVPGNGLVSVSNPTALYTDGLGNLLFGSGSSFSSWSSTIGQIQIYNTAAAGQSAFVQGQFSNNNTSTSMVFTKSRNTTVGSHTVVSSGDGTGQIVFAGSDGTDYEITAFISSVVDATPSNNDMPGRLAISTTPDGSNSPLEAVRWDNAQRQITGGIAAVAVGNTGSLQINGTTADKSQAQIVRYSADANSPTLAFGKSRNAAVGSNAIVQNGDFLGSIVWYGANGTTYTSGASIDAFIDGTPGASADMPSAIRFTTTPDGSGTIAEVLRLNSNQEVLVGVTARNANGGKLQIKAGGQTTNNANVGGTTYVNTTQTGNTAATETDAFSHSIAANTLSVNGTSLEFYAAGTFATSLSADKRVKAVFGGATLLDTGALSITTASDWSMTGKIIRTGAATQKATVMFTTSNSALVATTDYTTPTETLSGAVTMKLTVNGTNANDTVAELYKETWAAAA